MRDTDWDKFFDLLDKLVNRQPGTWQQKAKEVINRAQCDGAIIDLGEFINWFEDGPMGLVISGESPRPPEE